MIDLWWQYVLFIAALVLVVLVPLIIVVPLLLAVAAQKLSNTPTWMMCCKK